jgi:hypothetical protein
MHNFVFETLMGFNQVSEHSFILRLLFLFHFSSLKKKNLFFWQSETNSRLIEFLKKLLTISISIYYDFARLL